MAERRSAVGVAAALLAATLAAMLAGCAGGPMPVDRYFRLSATAPPALAVPALDGVVLVKRFAADGVLAQRPLVYARAAEPQVLYQYHSLFWADPPTRMLQAITAQALREARVAAQVVTPSLGVPSDYRIAARLERLEHLTGDAPAVVVAIELSVQHVAQRDLLLLRRYSEQVPAAGPGAAAAVAAMSEALSRILERFVADLARR